MNRIDVMTWNDRKSCMIFHLNNMHEECHPSIVLSIFVFNRCVDTLSASTYIYNIQIERTLNWFRWVIRWKIWRSIIHGSREPFFNATIFHIICKPTQFYDFSTKSLLSIPNHFSEIFLHYQSKQRHPLNCTPRHIEYATEF